MTHLHIFQFYVAAWYYNCLNSFFFSLIYTPYLIMTKWKQNFRNVCKFIKKKKLKYHVYISIQTLCNKTWNFTLVPQIYLDHCWEVSIPWVESTYSKLNWLDMIWKGTHLSKKGLTSWQCISEQKTSHEVKGTACRAQRQDCFEAQIWGRLQKDFCCTEGSQEHSGFHNSQMEEVWHNQDSSKSWSPSQTEQLMEKGLV